MLLMGFAGLALLLAATGLCGVSTRAISQFLFGVSPTDWATFIGVSLLLVATAAVASYLPARRASEVDPAVTLRSE